MKVFNLRGDEWEKSRDREGWRVNEVSLMIGPDVIEYLDTGKVFAESAAGERIMLARPGPTVDYWEGEE